MLLLGQRGPARAGQGRAGQDRRQRQVPGPRPGRMHRRAPGHLCPGAGSSPLAAALGEPGQPAPGPAERRLPRAAKRVPNPSGPDRLGRVQERHNVKIRYFSYRAERDLGLR